MPIDESQFASLKHEIEAFVRGPGEDYAEEIERSHEVPQALWLDLRERGYLSLAAPGEYGGRGVPFARYLELMELFATCTNIRRDACDMANSSMSSR